MKKTSIKVGDPLIYQGTKSIFKGWANPGKTIHIDWNDEFIEVPVKHISKDPDYSYTPAKGGPRSYSVPLKESQLVETIRKVDGKWAVFPKKGGKRLGTHDTKEKALAQLAAIEASKNEARTYTSQTQRTNMKESQLRKIIREEISKLTTYTKDDVYSMVDYHERTGDLPVSKEEYEFLLKKYNIKPDRSMGRYRYI